MSDDEAPRQKGKKKAASDGSESDVKDAGSDTRGSDSESAKKKRNAKKKGKEKAKRGEEEEENGASSDDAGDRRKPMAPRTRLERENKKPKAKLYKQISDPEVRRKIASGYIFDSVQWLQYFEEYLEKYPEGEVEAAEEDEENPVHFMRLIVQEGTYDACEDGYYTTEEGKRVTFEKKLKDLKRKVRETVFYNNHCPFEPANLEAFETTAHVVEGDALDVAIWLKRNRQVEPLVLNLADPQRPGGEFKAGAAGFEESVFRRTNLYQFLEDPYCYDPERIWSYPIPEYGGLFAKDVTVFRESEKKGYKFMETPETLAFVSMPPLYRPNLIESEGDKKLRMDTSAQSRWKKKISTLLNIALDKGYDSVVVSAWGCGRARNPPEQIANLFQDTILEEFMKKKGKKKLGAFRFIVFGIQEDHNCGKPHNPKGNLAPFQEVWTAEKPETVVKCLIS